MPKVKNYIFKKLSNNLETKLTSFFSKNFVPPKSKCNLFSFFAVAVIIVFKAVKLCKVAFNKAVIMLAMKPTTLTVSKAVRKPLKPTKKTLLTV